MRLLLIIIFSFTTFIHAAQKPYPLPITRQVTHTMIAHTFWSGEYPSPVISVHSKEKKWKRNIPGMRYDHKSIWLLMFSFPLVKQMFQLLHKLAIIIGTST